MVVEDSLRRNPHRITVYSVCIKLAFLSAADSATNLVAGRDWGFLGLGR